MKDTKEIKALFHLLDDPDEEIYQSVSEKIIHYGKDIIPNLENYSVQVEDNEVHNRIETIIHQVAYNDTFEQLKHWHEQINSSLLNASIILAKYNAPSCSDFDIQKTVKNIYQSCWLELNNYLTPLE